MEILRRSLAVVVEDEKMIDQSELTKVKRFFFKIGNIEKHTVCDIDVIWYVCESDVIFVLAQDVNIQVDFMLPTNEVEDDESDDMDINYTTDVKMPQLSYKLNKASLMRKYKSYRSWALLFSMNTDDVSHTDVSFITVYSSMSRLQMCLL